MEKTVFLSSCPVCGRSLFKGAPHSYIEGGCPKCKEYLQITFTDAGFQATVRNPTENSHTSDTK